MPFSLPRRQAVLLALATLMNPALSPVLAASAADWPTKPLRIVVGFPGGSSPDLVARTLAEPLSKALGQPVVVENKVGAGGNLAAEMIAHATDNHTLGVMINGNLTTARLLNPKLSFDPLKDLAPISLVATAPLVLTAQVNSPGATAEEFLTAARKAGSQWSYGTPGVGTVAHLGMEWFKSLTQVAPVHIPYPGNPQVINAMIGEQVQLALLPPGLALAQIKAGRLRAIGLTSSQRSTLAPEIPSLAEAGVSHFNLEIWTAVAAPATMPAALRERLSKLLSEIARSSDVRGKLFQQGWQVSGTSAEGLSNRIQSDTAVMGDVIRRQGIKAE
jgi:tripartite-type tricarboxylate transporter receptor subunit TctC